MDQDTGSILFRQEFQVHIRLNPTPIFDLLKLYSFFKIKLIYLHKVCSKFYNGYIIFCCKIDTIRREVRLRITSNYKNKNSNITIRTIKGYPCA